MKRDPAYATKPQFRSNNVTVIAAMTRDRVLMYKILWKTANGTEFCDYIEQLAETCHIAMIENPMLVMDNVAFHRMEESQTMMMNTLFEWKYLPAYTPQFNPIENLFSQWKHFVCQQEPKTHAELITAIDKVDTVVTSAHCANYFTQLFRNCQSCLNGENIFTN
jgi:hypothetical protein